MNIYKNGDCPGSIADYLFFYFFFLCVQKKKKKKKIQLAHFLTVCREIGNITFFFRPKKETKRKVVVGEKC